MARACSGMSGRVVASGAGDRSSVLVSPGTLNTVMVRLSGTSGWLVNHSARSEEHTSELQSLMRISYAVFCLKKKKTSSNPDNYYKTNMTTMTAYVIYIITSTYM